MVVEDLKLQALVLEFRYVALQSDIQELSLQPGQKAQAFFHLDVQRMGDCLPVTW